VSSHRPMRGVWPSSWSRPSTVNCPGR
jgi:hypothetical protein